jgi:cephalosporin-C deacetylase-like acetyl esterase
MYLLRCNPHLTLVILFILLRPDLAWSEGTKGDLAEQLRQMDPAVIPKKGGQEPSRMLFKNTQARLQAANRRENQAWAKVQTRQDWEAFRDARLQALRISLGPFPARPKDLKVRTSGKLEIAGCRIENLVFESRPGLFVTANLYLPAKIPEAMPGILIVHSHHNPRTQGELQDMGMTWARQGCAVLVPEMLGHGERRQHPFPDAASYPEPFKVGRQDYYFRYNTGVQLQLVGESLMGWMVWDLIRCLDVLLARPGIDRDRVLVVGSVAGGGDPAAVTAALDQRVTAVAPFNFGGPQPDYSVPAQAEDNFYWFGVPSWESTRCLRLGARDGFAQWLIVAAVAPRRLLYCHEFSWDEKRDPAWPRLQKVFGLYVAADHLAEAHGKGKLQGKPPESTHCNNVGPYHRSQMYPVLKRWFNMPVPAKEVAGRRRPAAELMALTPELAKELRPRPVHELAAGRGGKLVEAARRRLADLKPEARTQFVRDGWDRLLGGVALKGQPKAHTGWKERIGTVALERLALEPEPGILVPVILLLPAKQQDRRSPVVVAVAQQGKQMFLKERTDDIISLLTGGTAVCLPDVRGTGETRPGDSRAYNSSATTRSATELLLGQTLLGGQLRDLRAILHYLRGRPDLDADRLALWGDSTAPVNLPGSRLAVPPDVGKLPHQAEPLGGVLVLLAGLFEEDVRAIYARRGLASYQDVLKSPFIYLPHDVLVPGALTAGDLADVAAVLAPRRLCLEGLVDGLNQPLAAEQLEKEYAVASSAYRTAGAANQLLLLPARSDGAARWLLRLP